MNACAYFDKEKKGKCIETMEAHVKKGLELIEDLYIKRDYGKFLGRLLGVGSKTANDILRKTYALHDVGKCLEEFQLRGFSFGYHAFYSYLIAREALREFGSAGKVASAAILLHHHDWIVKESPEKPRNLELCSECISVIEDLSGVTIPSTLPWIDPRDAYETADSVLVSNLRAVYAILLPITVADNYAAACNRGGEGSALGKEIFEMLKVRGWNIACCIPSRL